MTTRSREGRGQSERSPISPTAIVRPTFCQLQQTDRAAPAAQFLSDHISEPLIHGVQRHFSAFCRTEIQPTPMSPPRNCRSRFRVRIGTTLPSPSARLNGFGFLICRSDSAGRCTRSCLLKPLNRQDLANEICYARVPRSDSPTARTDAKGATAFRASGATVLYSAHAPPSPSRVSAA
jgi:hypothetical protein